MLKTMSLRLDEGNRFSMNRIGRMGPETVGGVWGRVGDTVVFEIDPDERGKRPQDAKMIAHVTPRGLDLTIPGMAGFKLPLWKN